MHSIGLRTVICYENASESWSGERGLITAETVGRYLSPDDGRPFLVAGPPGMVASMERVLDEFGVDAKRRYIERFGMIR